MKSTTVTKAPNPNSGSSGRWFVAAIIAVFVLGSLLVAVVINAGGSDSSSGIPTGSSVEAVAPVDSDGTALQPFDGSGLVTDPQLDGAIGAIAPTLVGSDFSGNPIEIGEDGRGKAIMFLAHWCDHCRAEVPQVVDLIAEGLLPTDVDVYAVSTAVDSGGPNYPPNNWLDREEWPGAVLRDSATSDALSAYGGTSFPFVVYLDGDNRVIARSAGALPPEATEQAWRAISAAQE